MLSLNSSSSTVPARFESRVLCQCRVCTFPLKAVELVLLSLPNGSILFECFLFLSFSDIYLPADLWYDDLATFSCSGNHGQHAKEVWLGDTPL
jgi:hypothetical protein